MVFTEGACDAINGREPPGDIIKLMRSIIGARAKAA
jgi:hypothetical protein